MKKIRIAFLGNSDISINALKTLLNEKIEIKVVITNKDKAIGRSHSTLLPTPVATFAEANNLSLFKTNSINQDIKLVQKYEVDYIITCSFGQMLSEKVLQWPKIKPINIHTSLLPKGRGGAPIHWAIINGEKETGYSIMEMIDEMDAGDIFSQEKILINENDTLDILYEKLGKLIEDTFLEDFFTSVVINPQPIKQDQTKVIKWLNIKKDDRFILWNDSAINILNLIRGLNSKPLAYTIFEDKEIKIIKAKLYDNSFPLDKRIYNPGTIISLQDEYIVVQTKVGVLMIEEFIIPGKKPTTFKAFKNGNKNFFKPLMKFKIER